MGVNLCGCGIIRADRLRTYGHAQDRYTHFGRQDLIEGTDFDSFEELEDELLKYLVYYNWERPHQGINGKKPIDMVTLNNK